MQYEITDELLYHYMPLVDEAVIRRMEHELPEVTLSESFHKRMDILLRKRRARATALRHLVSLAAVLVLGFSITLSVNAEFRAKIVRWFISDHGEYSTINTRQQEPTDASFDDLKKYEIGYVPEGYVYVDTMELHREGINYLYSNGEKFFSVLIAMPNFENLMLNTEGMEKEELWYRDAHAYYYYGEYGTNFICSIDGYPVYIIGQPEITKEELLKVADEISNVE